MNRADARELMQEIREKYPTKTIWMYTGDSWEDIYDLPIMQYVDVVVDGEFHVEEKDVKVNGWQVEVAPKGFDTGGIYESYGRGWLIQIPDEKENILKQGEWNTMRIRVQGDNVQTWLNGEEMVNIRDEKIGAGQGRIALQIHDGGGIKVLWRNLHLQTL